MQQLCGEMRAVVGLLSCMVAVLLLPAARGQIGLLCKNRGGNSRNNYVREDCRNYVVVFMQSLPSHLIHKKLISVKRVVVAYSV